jgi:hypothetical protein
VPCSLVLLRFNLVNGRPVPSLHDVHCGKVVKIKPDRLFGDVGGLGNALLDRVKKRSFQFLIPPGSNIAANPYHVRRRLPGDILVAVCKLLEDNVYHEQLGSHPILYTLVHRLAISAFWASLSFPGAVKNSKVGILPPAFFSEISYPLLPI